VNLEFFGHGGGFWENPIVLVKTAEMGMVHLTLCFMRLFFPLLTWPPPPNRSLVSLHF
jgi:hypothetical protein